MQERASKDQETGAYKSEKEASVAEAASLCAQLQEAALKSALDAEVCSVGLLCCHLVLMLTIHFTAPTRHLSSVHFAPRMHLPLRLNRIKVMHTVLSANVCTMSVSFSTLKAQRSCSRKGFHKLNF